MVGGAGLELSSSLWSSNPAEIEGIAGALFCSSGPAIENVGIVGAVADFDGDSDLVSEGSVVAIGGGETTVTVGAGELVIEGVGGVGGAGLGGGENAVASGAGGGSEGNGRR